MIKVTRFNGVGYYLNCEHIETIENTPDTVITLRDGKKLLVSETSEEIIEKIIEYKKRIFDLSSLINKDNF
ncbi:MAG: flagellar FlbD family protein [Clostridiaceae bacterium]|nr:flagellar FlbD family protein [Clostridiaceae bacterium]